MADRSVWTYVVTTDLEVLPDGSTPVVFVARRRRSADARKRRCDAPSRQRESAPVHASA
jgi:hypothetical protein